METAEGVSADPCSSLLLQERQSVNKCFGCGLADKRKPTQEIKVTQQQVRARAKVRSDSFSNPFASLSCDEGAVLALCTACRSKETVWDVMSNPRKYGRIKAEKAVWLWAARTRTRQTETKAKLCTVCSSLHIANRSEHIPRSSLTSERQPTRDYTLFNIAVESEVVREEFVNEFCRRSAAPRHVVEKIVGCPSEHFFCAFHLNHSSFSQENCKKSDARRHGRAGGMCVFTGRGCSGSGSRLRPLPVFENSDIDSIELYGIFQDGVQQLSDGSIEAKSVQGKHCCSQCLYIVTHGNRGTVPNSDIQILEDSVDRWLVRCIRFALDYSSDVKEFLPVTDIKIDQLRDASPRLKASVIEPHRGVPILHFKSVTRCRQTLNAVFRRSESENVDPRTMESRIRVVLASSGIHLRRISWKSRVYVLGSSFESMLRSELSEKQTNTVMLTDKDRKRMLDDVAKCFSFRKDLYWNGNWSLAEEVSAIPTSLWSSLVLQMASKRKKNSWNIAAAASDKTLLETFPVSNRKVDMPTICLEDCLETGSNISRSDIILAVRTLKLIEQIVFSRTNSIAGPLTVCLSVSGIVEYSPSFVSVQNALGLSLSYNRTEQYRLRLIADREKAPCGAFQTVPHITDEVVPSCQFDNWDLLPLHAVNLTL